MSLLDTKRIAKKPWTPAELALLEAVRSSIPTVGLRAMVRRLKGDMPSRSEQSIEAKLVKLGKHGCAHNTSSSE